MIETIILICFGLLLLLVVDVIATPNRNKKHILSVTSLDRGTSSERALILKLIKNGVPSKAIFHDLMIKRGNNELRRSCQRTEKIWARDPKNLQYGKSRTG